MSQIQSYINELNGLNIELKRLNKSSSEIRKKIKITQNNILVYLNEKNQPGVKYQDMAIIVENKTKTIRKKKKDIEKDSIRVLENYGLANPELILKQILDARKGEVIEEDKIKIDKIDKIKKKLINKF